MSHQYPKMLAVCPQFRMHWQVIFLLLCASPVPVFAAKMEFKTVVVTYVKANNMQADAKKLNIELPKIDRLTITASATSDNPDPTSRDFTVTTGGTPAVGDFHLVITKNGENKTIADGEKITIKIRGPNRSKVVPKKAIWLNAADNTLATTEIPGSDVKGDPTYSVINEMTPSADILISELRLYYNHDPVDPDSADPLIWISDPSLVITTPINLLGFGSHEDFVVPEILVDKRFIAQGRIVDSSGNVIGAFIDSYALAPTVPAVSEWGLIVLMLLFLNAIAIKFCRRRAI